MPIMKIDGALLHWTSTGDGPVVLLLHSLGGSGDMWRTTVDRLAPRYRVLTLDARGHGGSQNIGAISVERYAADAMELLGQCAIDRAALVGLSMGGQAAMHIALTAPRNVSALVLADTSLGKGLSAEERMASVSSRVEEVGTAAFAEEYTRSRLMPDALEETVRGFSGLVEKSLPDAYIRLSGSIAAQDLAERPGDIAVPTLVLVGSRDVSTPPSTARALKDAIPGALLTVIPDANHLSNLDQPDLFNSAVEAFLDRAERQISSISFKL